MRGANASFPRSARLALACEFERVFANGVRSRDAGFTVLARRNDGHESRLGLVVSKRQIRRATRRNRVKRRIRESFRRRRALLDGLDVVVMAKGGVQSWDSAGIFAALEKHWTSVSERCADSRS